MAHQPTEQDKSLPANTAENAEKKNSEELPKVTIDWSLEPTTHSYSGSINSPTLTLFLTNHADRPITIYNEHIIPAVILAEGGFQIFDQTSNTEVDQRKTRFCDFVPPSKVHVPLREQLFHTLPPGVPVAFTAAFGRSKTPSLTRLPRDGPGDRDRKWARGVHGLEIGHTYSLRPGPGWGGVRWWEWGEKEEVINPPGSKRLDGRTIAYKHHKTPHPRIRVNVEELKEIEFKCVA